MSEDWFSHDEARMMVNDIYSIYIKRNTYLPIKTKLKMNSLCNDGTLLQFIHTDGLVVC